LVEQNIWAFSTSGDFHVKPQTYVTRETNNTVAFALRCKCTDLCRNEMKSNGEAVLVTVAVT